MSVVTIVRRLLAVFLPHRVEGERVATAVGDAAVGRGVVEEEPQADAARAVGEEQQADAVSAAVGRGIINRRGHAQQLASSATTVVGPVISPGCASSPSMRDSVVLRLSNLWTQVKAAKAAICPRRGRGRSPTRRHETVYTANAASLPSFRQMYIDTGCSHNLGPRSVLADAILHEWPASTEYTMARREASFTTTSVAAVCLLCTDIYGNDARVVMRVNVGPEDLPFLIKPLWVHIVAPPQRSWISVVDYYGKERKLRVDEPQGGAGSHLPTILWRPQQSANVCLTVSTPPTQLTHAIVLEWHTRLFHPCAERLSGTLLEHGITTTPAEIKRILGPCSVCDRKNATHRTFPRRTARGEGNRGADTFGWDLAHFPNRGYKGEQEVSLLVHEESLLWHAAALKQKGDAPDHLQQVLYDIGSFRALRSDRAPELIGVRVKLICQENNIHMVEIPPRASGANGIVERAIRELRMLLAIIIHSFTLPREIWPALLAGVCELHNKLYSPVLKSSPWLRYYGYPPLLRPVIGDTVVVRMPSEKNQPKIIKLPGTELMYLGSVNVSTTIVLDRRDMKVHRVHPSQLLSVRPWADGDMLLSVAGAAASIGTSPIPVTSAPSPPPTTTLPGSRARGNPREALSGSTPPSSSLVPVSNAAVSTAPTLPPIQFGRTGSDTSSNESSGEISPDLPFGGDGASHSSSSNAPSFNSPASTPREAQPEGASAVPRGGHSSTGGDNAFNVATGYSQSAGIATIGGEQWGCCTSMGKCACCGLGSCTFTRGAPGCLVEFGRGQSMGGNQSGVGRGEGCAVLLHLHGDWGTPGGCAAEAASSHSAVYCVLLCVRSTE
eukprot:GHVU01039269.1.p1 GENE.GHVU01039269.1~~GHVU01039269.1.p1  ORF type:complete len:838 (+),score=36.94 GHVU01039269.1:1101-3614(+)